MQAPSHEVFNQTPPLVDYNLFTSDPALREGVRRTGAGAADAVLDALGAALGSAAVFELGRLANGHPPALHTHDPQGRRIDRIEFHPAWHELMRELVARGLHTGPWATPGQGAHVARAAAYVLQGQIEAGTLCPATMTYGAVPALRRDPTLGAAWLPLLLSRSYDAHDLPAAHKRGALIGMGMTEKQGGSDVRANTTRAERQHDDSYRLFGHKWFFSAPQADAHLVLAQAEAGLSCFLVPRFTPDGAKNSVLVQRLKDKVGNRSNASGEVEFDGAWAQLLGAEGRGVATILEVASYTRLDCVLGSAALMRQAVVLAIHHARHRHAFGQALIEQALMQTVLVDLALESQAATALGLRLACMVDAGEAGDADAQAGFRLMTAAGKYWVCKRGPMLAAEAMEVLGGNGYVEEGRLGRIYREAPVNSIWEGSGNIMCLDVLRTLVKVPRAAEWLLAELAGQRQRHAAFDRAYERLAKRLPQADEAQARGLVQDLVVLVQAGLLLDAGCTATAAAFCDSRLGRDGLATFGALTGQHDAATILTRCFPGP